ncbi:hypothetical protein [Robertkochia sediminum]|uniref:hypothetical protein n=1 Tax=Robertkochia sediminum TaxID=2785326 RepID=UPI0019334E8C|nr:hypothetical protein [Robertkochia sediminum]MBL7472059.1 hypothetical protein [Robertkochia sediminum]
MNRKLLVPLLFTTLLMSVLNAGTHKFQTHRPQEMDGIERIEDEYIKITYNQKVNGYDVRVTWKPEMMGLDEVIGPAILEFKKSDAEFTITNNYFSLPMEAVDLNIDQGGVVGINKNNISLDYHDPGFKDGGFDAIDVPFVFVDLDFDGNEELVVTKTNQGQRYVNAYSVYSVEDGGLAPAQYQLTDQKPFSELDAMAELNREKKEITLIGSGGYCFVTFETYSLINGAYALTKIVEMERDDNEDKCYKFVYDVVNGIKKLMSKEEMQ